MCALLFCGHSGATMSIANLLNAAGTRTSTNVLRLCGQDGIYSHTFEYEKDPDCLVCSQAPKKVKVRPSTRVSKFSEAVAEQLYVHDVYKVFMVQQSNTMLEHWDLCKYDSYSCESYRSIVQFFLK